MSTNGWKVVRKHPDGTLSSAVISGYWGQFYAVGLRTAGYEGTPVLAFRTRQAARHFRRFGLLPTCLAQPIFKARLENPRPQFRVAVAWKPDRFTGFWKGVTDYSVDAPDGTLACDAITLLEK